jgi:RNA polymerase sigma-70 factor (ECF subfamily)
VLAFPLDADNLLLRTARGETAAFGALYDATSARVHGLVVGVLHDPVEAETVTEEVFRTVWRTAGRFDPEAGTALTWITALAHRHAVERVRTSSRRSDAHGAAEGSASLACLPPLERGAVELAWFGGRTYRELAEVLGVGSGTVRNAMRDGLARLRRMPASVG